MVDHSYQERRGQIETYFDRTAVEAWSQLTSDVKVSRVRATVRAGRDKMRHTLLSWLPTDLTGKKILDAGCGTGLLAIEAARRGADVIAIDVAPTLIKIAQERLPQNLGSGSVQLIAGDMLDPSYGSFDYIIAMDSLIHYQLKDIIQLLVKLSERTRSSIIFTFAPRTLLLTLMHAVGRYFPRGDRAPAIEPLALNQIIKLLKQESALQTWQIGRMKRITVGFYTSQALELIKTY